MTDEQAQALTQTLESVLICVERLIERVEALEDAMPKKAPPAMDSFGTGWGP